MKLQDIIQVVQEVLPKIQTDKGTSKYNNEFPLVEYDDTSWNLDGEYDSQENIITIYSESISSKQQLIQTLLHEYQHYLQSPLWMKRYYTMGHTYESHPYEVEAIQAENSYKLYML